MIQSTYVSKDYLINLNVKNKSQIISVVIMLMTNVLFDVSKMYIKELLFEGNQE